MNKNNIKFKAVQNPRNKLITIEIYINLGNDDNPEWVMIDRHNELAPSELKSLADFIYGLFKKKDTSQNSTT